MPPLLTPPPPPPPPLLLLLLPPPPPPLRIMKPACKGDVEVDIVYGEGERER
jgi:hypothetical protein